MVKQVGDVPTVLDQFQRMLDDYGEATVDCGINDATKKTIMMQLLPQPLRVATRDTLMAARQTFVSVSPDYLRNIITQCCEFDEAALGGAIPMDARAVEAAVVTEDAGSMCRRAVGPGPWQRWCPPRACCPHCTQAAACRHAWLGKVR